MTHRVYFEVIFRDIPRSRFTRTTVYQPKSREPGLKLKSSEPPGQILLRARLPRSHSFYVEPRPNDVQRKTSVPCRTVPGAVVAWADDSRFSRRRVADANERRNREGTKAVTSVEQGALGGARERAR
jgi:hypothetical protein